MRRPLSDNEIDCRLEEIFLAQNPNRLQGCADAPGLVLIYISRLDARCKCGRRIRAGEEFTSEAISGMHAHEEAVCVVCRPVVRRRVPAQPVVAVIEAAVDLSL